MTTALIIIALLVIAAGATVWTYLIVIAVICAAILLALFVRAWKDGKEPESKHDDNGRIYTTKYNYPKKD